MWPFGMSGIDEQQIDICPCCKRKVETWIIILTGYSERNWRIGDHAWYNQSKPLISSFGRINSETYRRYGADELLSRLESFKCDICKKFFEKGDSFFSRLRANLERDML